jgi:4-hydroxy-tetrahydrodipicolinate synthase
LAGYIADLPTPFDENGVFDPAAFAKLCERQIQAASQRLWPGTAAVRDTCKISLRR